MFRFGGILIASGYVVMVIFLALSGVQQSVHLSHTISAKYVINSKNLIDKSFIRPDKISSASFNQRHI